VYLALTDLREAALVDSLSITVSRWSNPNRILGHRRIFARRRSGSAKPGAARAVASAGGGPGSPPEFGESRCQPSRRHERRAFRAARRCGIIDENDVQGEDARAVRSRRLGSAFVLDGFVK
jgi:hypothetical protein